MRKISLVWALLFLFGMPGWAPGQVLAPAEITDAQARQLQEKYLPELKALGAELLAHRYPYAFYFSRLLDMDEAQQRRSEQRSVRFDKYHGQLVLEITGNYYAAYSGAMLDSTQRAQRTFRDVMLPILKAAVPRFAGNAEFQAYALEVAHHVRGKVLGVETENSENLTLVLPRAAAERLVQAQTPAEQDKALAEGEVFVDAQPIVLALAGESASRRISRPAEGSRAEEASAPSASPSGAVQPPPIAVQKQDQPAPRPPQSSAPAEAASTAGWGAPGQLARVEKSPELPAVAITQETLDKLQTAHQETISKLVRELDAQAHFVTYAPPSFISFHNGVYLQLSFNTPLGSEASGSQYKLAALAFDNHVSHLVRPVLKYFQASPGFDGIDFSTSVRVSGQERAGSSLAVEFILPFSALHCFQHFDCTGQQLLNAGFVLINGERVGLDLQTAEGAGTK